MARGMSMVMRVSIAVVLLVGPACGSRRTPDFNSADPGDKLYAIRASTAEGHTSQPSRNVLEHLVEQLGSDDPAVRMMAVVALEKITGGRKGYDPYASRRQRQGAIDAWGHALESGELDRRGEPTEEPAMTRGQADGSE